MPAIAPPAIDVQILEEVISPDQPTLTAPVARAVAGLAFSKTQITEIQRLLDKNNAGTISNRERDKLESYTRVGNFLNLLRAKARVTLSHQKSGS